MQGRGREESQISVWPFTVLIFILILSDRILKFIIFDRFQIGLSSPLIKGIVYITPIYNKGIAFGLFKESSNLLFIIITSLATAFIAYLIFFNRPRHRLLLSGLSFMFAGALSNLIDRIFFGHVLDFIDLKIWPIFNIADSAITIGAALILLHLFLIRAKS